MPARPAAGRERAGRPRAGPPRVAAAGTGGGGFAWTLAAALAVAALVHAPALGGYFSGDDITFLSRARGLEPTPWGFRPLTEALAFRAGLALFGLAPGGFLLANLALHLGNALWAGLIGARLARSRGAGAAAALLFGASSIAFTPLHWATGVVELLTAQFLLAGTWLWLEARESGRRAPRWGALACGLAAALSKETAVMWPLALAGIEWAEGRLASRMRALAGPLALAAGAAALFFASGQPGRFAESEAYRRTWDPAFLALNFSTYLGWSVDLGTPMRDAIAAVGPRALIAGLPVAAAALAALFAARHARPRPEFAGAAWFVALLAPVLPLEHHTYLYYLYVPWAGACWAISGAAARVLARTSPRAAAAAALALLACFAGLEARNVRARRADTLAGLPRDRTVREGQLLARALPALRAARLAAGEEVGFVNPLPRARASLTSAGADSGAASYVPLEAAFRGGETLRLFFPGVVPLGFARDVPPSWERARIFLYGGRGDLADWGRGQVALRHLAEALLASERWEEAAAAFARLRASGDTLPDALYGQMAALSALGRAAEADRLAAEFVRRWPGDPLAAEVRAALARPAPAR